MKIREEADSFRTRFVHSLYELTLTNFFIIRQALAHRRDNPSRIAIGPESRLAPQPSDESVADPLSSAGYVRIRTRQSGNQAANRSRNAPRGSASTRNSNQNIESRVAEAQLSPALRIYLASPASGWPDAICKGVTPSRQNNDFQLQTPRSRAALTFP